MSKKAVSVELSAESVEAIQAAFPEFSSKEELLKKVTTFAVAQVADWLSGRARFRSLSEQYIEWVADLMETVLPEQRPTVDRLYNEFNMPHGQATYIARVLSERKLSIWRQAARLELKQELTKHQKQAKDLSEAKQPDQSMEFTLQRLVARELSRIAERTWQQNRKVQIPSVSPLGPDTVSVLITARTLLLLLDAPEVKDPA